MGWCRKSHSYSFPLSFSTTEGKLRYCFQTLLKITVVVNSSCQWREIFTRKIFWGKFFVVAAITSQNGTFIFFFWPKMNPYWHIIITQKSWFILTFILGVIHSTSLDKCTMIYIYHYDTIQSSFTAPKILYTLPIYLPILTHPNPGNHWSFCCIHSFAFSRMSHSCIHTVCSLFRLVSFTSDMHLRFLLPVFSWLDSSFLFHSK